MEFNKSKSVVFLKYFRQYSLSTIVVLGVASTIIYDYTLTQQEKANKKASELTDLKLKKE